MVTANFVVDTTEIATQVAEAAAGLGSLISGFENIALARRYYDLYNQQRQFYYNTFQNGAERNLATQAYGEAAYVINYASRVDSALNPATGVLTNPITDVVGWVMRRAAMFAQGMDSEITELSTDNAKLRSDWVNYLYRFEELWADIRNDNRWAHRLTVHNVGIKQGTSISAALGGAVQQYSSQITDLASQLATYGNGIAKYAGYKRGLQDTAEDFTVGTAFSRRPAISVDRADNFDTSRTA